MATIELGTRFGMVRARSAGTGRTVLLLHGIRPEQSARTWEGQIFALSAAGYRAIAPDMPGHGDSAPHEGKLSVAEGLGVATALLAQMGVERASVIGSSWGGHIALEMALTFPAMVDRLILCAADYDDSPAGLERLKGMTKPALIVWGEDDPIIQLKYGRLLKETLPDARLEIFPPVGGGEAAHYPHHLTARFNEVMFEFLSKTRERTD